MTFEKVEVGAWDPKPNEEIVGILLKVESDVGTNNSMMYTIEVDKKPIAIWGATLLDPKMTAAQIGDTVKIVFLGLGEAKSGKHAPKMYDVYVDRDTQDTVPTIKI